AHEHSGQRPWVDLILLRITLENGRTASAWLPAQGRYSQVSRSITRQLFACQYQKSGISSARPPTPRGRGRLGDGANYECVRCFRRLLCGYLALLPAAAIGSHLAGVCVVHAFGDAFKLGTA